MNIIKIKERDSVCRAIVDNRIIYCPYSRDSILSGIPLNTFGFYLEVDPSGTVARPYIAHFVKISENELVGLGLLSVPIYEESNLIMTDFEGFNNGDQDVYNDVLIDTEQ